MRGGFRASSRVGAFPSHRSGTPLLMYYLNHAVYKWLVYEINYVIVYM